MKSLLIGLIAGIVSYFLVQLLLKCLRPRVFISEKIGKSKIDNQYRIKVSNLSKRDIGDIVIKVSYRSKTKGHYTFSVKEIPMLHSCDSPGNSITAKINPAKIAETREESVEEFFDNNPKGFVEVEMTYCDKSPLGFLWGNIHWTEPRKYDNTETIVHNAVFLENSCEPQTIMEGPSYKNC